MRSMKWASCIFGFYCGRECAQCRLHARGVLGYWAESKNLSESWGGTAMF
jgi:hypothetical protein